MLRKFLPVSVPTKEFRKEGELRKQGIASFCELVRQVPVVTSSIMQADSAGSCCYQQQYAGRQFSAFITIVHKIKIE